jgi:undecaprenyl-diphosphatase
MRRGNTLLSVWRARQLHASLQEKKLRMDNDRSCDAQRHAGTQPVTRALAAPALVLIAGIVAFALLAQQVAAGAPITALDATIARWFHAHATLELTRAMVVVSDLHRPVVLDALAILVAAVLWRRHHRLDGILFAAAVIGGLALNGAVKLAFHRPRPAFDNPLVVLQTYSFPSGHALGATLLYGMLVVCVGARLPKAGSRALVVAWAVFMTVLVATSRLYLGAHYLTDVLAGTSEGIAVVAACDLVLRARRR